MVNPVPGHSVSTVFGKPGSWAAGYHTGEDTACPYRSKVVCTKAGTVIYSGNGGGWGSAYGQQVIVDTDGRRHLYAHLDSRSVGYGQRLQTGQTIGYADNTGRSYGHHLHYEERINDFTYGSDSRKPIFPAYSSTTPTPTPTTCFGDYCYGKEAAAHRAMQRRLKDKGHDPGYGDWPTTYYGDGSKNAMATFQRSMGWSGSDADGMPGPGTMTKLGLPERMAYRSSKRVYLSKMVKGQADSDSVFNVQMALLLKGYSIPAGPSDYYGDQTITAVKAFQEDQGWSGSDADGFPGPGTLKLLGLQVVDDIEDPDPTSPPPVPPTSEDKPEQPEGIPANVIWAPIRRSKDGTWVTGLRKFSTSPGGKPKIVLHTTETDGIPNWEAMGAGYPHFTDTGTETRMHIPLDMAAYTLKGGQHSPNSAAGVVIQIEMVGYAKDVPNWPQARWDRLKALLVAIAKHIDMVYVFPFPFTDDAGYGAGGEVRQTWEMFRDSQGVVGHSHVPYNDHWDPGELPVEKLTDRAGPDPEPPVTPPEQGNARDLLLANGWDGESDDEVDTALAVMWCESHGYTDAVGDLGLINEKWGPSVGLPQIRTLQEVDDWAGQPDGVRDIDKLRDPGEQVKAMQVLKNQYGWQQWSTHPDSAERKGRDPIKDYECFHEAKGKDFPLRTGHENAECWTLDGCEDGTVPPPIEPPVDPDPPTAELGDAPLRHTLSDAFMKLSHAIDNLE